MAPPPTVHGRSTEMLTVWRRVHIEVDSMGIVTGNLLAGFVKNVVAKPTVLHN